MSGWALGLALASVVPALLVSPSVEADPSGTELVVALGATVVGSLVMVLSAYLLYRRTGSIGAAIIAFVPSFVLVVFGVLLTTITTLY
jgi:drug/metabolite transporter (DMT)-like permease